MGERSERVSIAVTSCVSMIKAEMEIARSRRSEEGYGDDSQSLAEKELGL